MREGPGRGVSPALSLAGLTLFFRCAAVRAGDFDGALVLAGVFLAGLLAAGDLRAGLFGAGDLGRPGLLGRVILGRPGLFGARLFLPGLLAFLAGLRLGDFGVVAFFCGDRGVLEDVAPARDALRLRLRLVTRFVLGDFDDERLREDMVRVLRLVAVGDDSVSTLLFLGGPILACYSEFKRTNSTDALSTTKVPPDAIGRGDVTCPTIGVFLQRVLKRCVSLGAFTSDVTHA